MMTAFLAARALHVDVAFTSLLVIMPAALLVSILPVSIGGLGLREGTMVSLLAISPLRLSSRLPGVFLVQMRATPPLDSHQSLTILRTRSQRVRRDVPARRRR